MTRAPRRKPISATISRNFALRGEQTGCLVAEIAEIDGEPDVFATSA